MANAFEAPSTPETPDPKKESARNALREVDGELREKIIEHPELVKTLAWVDSQGRTVQAGFYGDIKEVDPALAKEYITAVTKKDGPQETHIDRVIEGSDMNAEAALAVHKLHLEANKALEISPFEREKTAEELTMIERASENVNQLRAKHGLAPADLKMEDVHMLRKESNTVEGKEGGSTGHSDGEAAVVTEYPKEAARFATIQHELIHLGGYNAINVPKDSDEPKVYRVGLQVQGQKPDEEGNYPSFLSPLNEAVTEENARRITMAIPESDPELGKLTTKRKQSLEDMEAIRKRGNPVADAAVLQEELYFTDVDWEKKTLDVQTSSYSEERKAMWQLFDKIHEKNPDAFPGKSQEEAREAMFDMATKAALTGNIMPFGRLMNDTFGRGTFREYGHLQTPQEIVTLIDSLDAVKAVEAETSHPEVAAKDEK